MTHSSSAAEAPDPEVPESAAAKLFDVRLLIGGLFVVYGVLLTISGFFASDAEKDKAAGLNINLWLGIGMLLLGIGFLVWRALNPQHIEANPTPLGGEPNDG